MSVLERIKILCKKRGITISDLETKLDIPHNTIYQWGKRTPKVERLRTIANYFYVTTDYLIGETNNEHDFQPVDESTSDMVYMSLVDKIKSLCTERKITFAEVEREIGISNGQIRRWNTSSPKIETVKKVADYFNVSTDYLLGRTQNKYWELKDKDDKDIAKRLESIKNDLESGVGLAFDGEPMDDITKELVLAQIENNMRTAKITAKQKFTPKKYRD